MHHRTLRRLSGLVTALTTSAGMLVATSVPAAAAAPSNDMFAGAEVITTDANGKDWTNGSTEDSTLEVGEPVHTPDGSPTNGSVWYRYTAPKSGNLSVYAAGGGSLDTVVAVYTGATLNGLTRLAANDDDNADTPTGGVDNLPVTAGTTYRIAVATKGAEQGDFQLITALTDHPLNDNLSHMDVWALGSTITTWNVNATVEAGEPEHLTGTAPNSTLWWQLDAVHNGTLGLSTFGSQTDTVLAVYREDTAGIGFAGLTRIAANDDASQNTVTSAVSGLDIKAGHRYFIVVGGFDATDQGKIVLRDSWVQSTRPDNDDFADARPVPAGGFGVVESTVTATTEPGEPSHSTTNSNGKSVWFTFVPQKDSGFSLDLEGSTYDTLVSVYRGTSFSNLVRVAEDRGALASPARPTRLQFVPVSAGQRYYVAVAGTGSDSGTLSAEMGLMPSPRLTALSATGGPLAGGNTLTLTGREFLKGGTAVFFGDTMVKPATVVEGNPATLTLVVPTGLNGGPLPVRVATPGGYSAPLTYVVGEPTATGPSPAYSGLAGGVVVRLTGSDFVGTPVVKVGGVPATGVTVLSGNALTFVTPRRASAGTVPVTVQTANGTTTAGSLTYLPRPTVTRLSRSAGPHRGGYAVTVSGRGLVAVSKVLVGSRAASFSLIGGKLVVTVPKGRSGRLVYIRVVTPGGTSAAVKGARFRYR